MVDAIKNFASSQVVIAPVPPLSGTTLTVLSTNGGLFPAPPFNVVLWPPNQLPTATNAEIVRVTGVSSDTFTVVRNQEGTTAQTITSGWNISQNFTAALFAQITPANSIISLTGDVTTPAATSQGQSVASTLASITTAQTAGDSTHYPIVTIDTKGRVTGITSQAISAGPNPASTVTGPDAYGSPAVVGTGTTYARSDHDHGLPAAPALTYVAGALGSNVTIAANSVTTIFSTSSLPIGTWLVNLNATILAPSGSYIAGQALLGNAVGTFSGQTSFESYVSASTVYSVAALSFIVQITTAGTLQFNVVNQGSVTGTVYATTTINGIPNATGYTALKIA